MTSKSLPSRRSAWFDAERAWRAEVERQLGPGRLYDEAAEGRMVGRGKKAEPDKLRRLFLAAQAARDAYFAD